MKTPSWRDYRPCHRNAAIRLAVRLGEGWSGAIATEYARAVEPTVLGAPDLSYVKDTVGGA